MMSHNQPYRYNNESSARFQQPSASSSQLELEDKPYDLTDDYHTYSYPSQHQAFNADAQKMFNNNHNRRPSIPLHLATKDSYDKSDDVVQSAYPPTAPQASDADNISFWQRILPDSLACRLFVLTVILETIVDLAIEGELLIRVHEEKKLVEGQTSSAANADDIANADVAERSMQSYLALFAVAHVFQLLMACHAVYTRNTLQFMFLIALNALFLVAALVQIKEVKETLADAAGLKGVTSIPINVLTAIIPAVIALAEVAYIALGWRIYNEFGWQVFKFLGADRRIKKMYAKFQIYECLIKFDFFFFAAFSIELIYLVLDKTDWEYYVTIVALPLSLILLLEGHLAARHESKMMMITFMIGCVGAMVYFVYKLAKVLLLKDADHIFHFTWKTLTVFAIFAIMLLFATFVFSMMVIQNFGRGLKESLVKKDAVQSSSIHRRNQSQNLYRMSIG